MLPRMSRALVGATVSVALLLAGVALGADGGSKQPLDTPDVPGSSDGRGVMRMPTAWAQEARGDLVRWGVVGRAAAAPAWGAKVTHKDALAIYAKACEYITGKPTDVGEIVPDDVPGDRPVTRLEFAKWLDRLTGSPALPAPPQVVKDAALLDELHRGVDLRWGINSEEGLEHPEKFEVFTDLPTTDDRALVHRLAWWLVIRPNQRYGDRRFFPDRAVDWNEFTVCLSRAIRFRKPDKPDRSTPKGALQAWQQAFWQCDFEGTKQIMPAGADDETIKSYQTGMMMGRFSFHDPLDVIDCRVTKVKATGRHRAVVTWEYIPAFGNVHEHSFDMQEEDGKWVIPAD